jgi:hypothetical protein
MNSPPRSVEFLLSEAEGYRSREVVQIPQGAVGLWPGTFVDAAGAPIAAAGEANVAGILAYAVNPVDGPVNATVFVRDCEVTDAYLMYGALNVATINSTLAAKGVIVRAAVLKNVQSATFGVDVPPSGPPIAGIQSVGDEAEIAKAREEETKRLADERTRDEENAARRARGEEPLPPEQGRT